MASIKEMYDHIYDGNRLVVDCYSIQDYHAIRVGLAKIHAQMVGVDLSNQSLCSDYKADDLKAEYWLGVSRKRAARDWSIVAIIPGKEVTNG